MAKLILSETDMLKAIKQYYKDYEPNMYKAFDFGDLGIDTWMKINPSSNVARLEIKEVE